jgi:hypothetical protein
MVGFCFTKKLYQTMVQGNFVVRGGVINGSDNGRRVFHKGA